MCKAKPGPRCDKVALANLARAKSEADQSPTEFNMFKLSMAQEDVAITSTNIQRLRAEGKDDEADYFQQMRDESIAAAELIQYRKSGKWGQLALKEMDPSMLTHAINEVLNMDQGSIQWGDSSPEQFQDAMMWASFLHRDQTRANRAGFSRTPYVEHPLRNTLRLLRMGCTDGETLVASVLHDTIEDCSDKISGRADLPEEQQRAISLQKMSDRYTTTIAYRVNKVSNRILPKTMPKPEKMQVYLTDFPHKVDTEGSYLVKLVDLSDNGGGLHHNFIPGQERFVRNGHKKYSASMVMMTEIADQIEFTSINKRVIKQEILGIRKNLESLGRELAKLDTKK